MEQADNIVDEDLRDEPLMGGIKEGLQELPQKLADLLEEGDEANAGIEAAIGDLPKKEEIGFPGSGITVEISSKNASDSSTINIKTGTSQPLMKTSPIHIKDSEDFEPLYIPQENILEECLRREAERVSHQENLMNRVVYDCVDPSPYNPPLDPNSVTDFYIPTGPDDHTMVFESRFESGNLRRAVQVYEFEYDLILKPDYNTRGCTQWFYFRVSNTKPDSLYNHGMRPLVYSEIDGKKYGKGWTRGCNKVCYYQNSMKRKAAGYYYTLTFTITFQYKNDIVYFAHCYPYTYSDLARYMNQLENDPRKKERVRRRTLCQTIAGNNCDVLIITNFQGDPESIKNRKGVVLSGRVHPGESSSSYMMKGAIDFLTGPTLKAKILRDNFVFKVVPMLNPDGVINGNSRCSLAGVDLNRVWIDPSKKLHPTLYHTKMMLKKLSEDRDIFLYCDFHGHSRKKNVFMYGCSGKNNERLKERIFPCLLSKNCEIFSFVDSSFAIQKSKESTARVVMWKELNIVNSYTIESSFCGADFGKFADYHFNTDLLQEVGHTFCISIYDFCDHEQIKVKAILEELEIMFPKKDDESDPDNDSNADSDFSGDEAIKKKKKKKQGKKKGKKEGDKANGGGMGAGMGQGTAPNPPITGKKRIDK